jgi:hypothetical protein
MTAGIEPNAAALLALVEDDAARRIDAALATAYEEAARVRREAHAAARAAVRVAYVDERHRHRERVRAAEAARDTRLRLAAQALDAATVAAGLAALPDALRARWRDDPARCAWIDDAFAQARTALPTGTWRVLHPVDWPAAEREALGTRIAAVAREAPTFEAVAGLDAGLALEAHGTRVDATVAGLLADHGRLGARLLHFAHARPAERGA